MPDIDIGRLRQAIRNSRLVLRKPRQVRYDMVRQTVGGYWSEEGASKDVPCNILSTYINIVGRKLIADNPQVMLSSWNRSAKPTVKAEEKWLNKQLPKIGFRNTMARIAIDSLYSLGIAFTHIATPADAALMGWRIKAGDPIVNRVDLDDLAFDPHCHDLTEAGFIAHRFRAPLAVIRDSKMYGKGRKKLEASSDQIYNLEGDERIGLLGRTTLGGDAEEFEDFIDLWYVWYPRHRVILTLADELQGSDNWDKALRIQKWVGPDAGPYNFLGMMPVPGNPMPLPPLQIVFPLHLALNNILRKLILDGMNFKEVMAVKGQASEDGERILQTNHGEAVKVNDPEAIKQLAMRAPNQALFQLFLALKELVSWLCGNLDIMGGLSPQSKTAHQDAMLNANSSATVAEMQAKMVGFTQDVVGSLLWFYHHHPSKRMTVEHPFPGMPSMSVSEHITPQQRHIIPWDDIDYQIDAYSLQAQTPQSRLQGIMETIQMIMPLMPMAQQQGINLDLDALLQIAAKLRNEPRIGEILTLREPPPVDEAPSSPGAGAGMPQETTRNYNRQSLAGESSQAKNAAIMNMGGNPKLAETNGMIPMGGK